MERMEGQVRGERCVRAAAAISVYAEARRREGACTSSQTKHSDSAAFVPGVA